ncbi:LpqN/LpqT family lipoprotein, partial [Mycolicibacterium chitae]
MFSKARSWRVVAGGAAAGVACVVGFVGSTTAAADPVLPAPPAPVPAPVTVTQTVTAAPVAAGTAPSAAAVPQAVPQQAVPHQPAALLAAPAVPTLAPATSGTLREYFADKGVALEAQDPRVFEALHITLPMPPGWTQVPDPNVPDAYVVIADRASGGLYTSNAQVVIYRLVGEFDPKEAITHGYVDSQQLPAWQSTDASLADFGGFPSALIEGTYTENELPLNTSRRHVIAKAGADHYLVSLAVTTSVSQAVATADATDAIVNGFRVTDPATPTALPVAPAPATPGDPAAVAPAP